MALPDSDRGGGARGWLSEVGADRWRSLSGVTLRTLRDAGEYIMALPKKEHAAPEWQAAMQALMLVAEGGGPPVFARIGVMRALNQHYVPSLNPKGKELHWGRRKLKRDQ